MRADIRLSAIAVGLALCALLVPYLALKLVVIAALAASLVVAVLAR